MMNIINLSSRRQTTGKPPGSYAVLTAADIAKEFGVSYDRANEIARQICPNHLKNKSYQIPRWKVLDWIDNHDA